MNKSTKSYGTAVSLCGIFGILGFHHFYLGNFLHGIFDLVLFLFGFLLIYDDNPVGYFLILIDVVHSVIIFYNLITEQQKDSNGLIVRN